MKTSSTGISLIKLHCAPEIQLCPECGVRMSELNRLIEGGLTYVWFGCSREECDGQWMQICIGSIVVKKDSL